MSGTLSLHDDPTGEDRVSRSAILYLVLETERPAAGSVRIDLGRAGSVLVGRGPERAVKNDGPELKLEIPDGRISSSHARFRRVAGRWMVEDLQSKNGTLVRGEPITKHVLEDGDLIEVGQCFMLFRADDVAPDGLITDSSQLPMKEPTLRTFQPDLAERFTALARVARAQVPVLVLGETGTGKEVVARAVHRMSARSGSFVPVNCGAIPQHLVESELFGVKKGAYSGADKDRNGLVMAADHGTLFLDELGDLPEASQAALLRVLQEKEVLPVGASQTQPVEFRLVAATHRDLAAYVAEGRFRGDLLARVSGVMINLPPLRERTEDLGILIGALLEKLCGPAVDTLKLSVPAARALFAYPWPFNVRELEKALEAAVAMAEDGRIEAKHLPESLRYAPGRSGSRPALRHSTPTGTPRTLPAVDARPAAPPRPLSSAEEQQKAELLALLEAHGGNLSAVSRATGKARMQLHRWLKRFQIDPSKYRDS
ncbi:MAG: sigma 54-interacting transcriptional regulator [Myxococcota bacterium]